MAVKITRQPKKIVLIGAPSSAAAHSAGTEAAPAALRAAGIAARFEQIGYEVSDGGAIPAVVFQPDESSPRARSARPTVKSLEALQPLAERALKSGALPVILGGDCTITMAVLAAIRRYHQDVSLIYCDGDADLNTPATTPSGYFDGMVVAHITGQGAPELVRFFNQPPLVREPDIALFGLARLDAGEQKWLEASPMRRFTPDEIREMGPAAAAEAALERIHTFKRQWVLHFDVDVLSADEFAANEFGAPGGLRMEDARGALEVFVKHANLAAVVITEYVPSKDPDGTAARALIDLFAGALAARYKALVPVEGSREPEAKAADDAGAAAAPAEQPTGSPATEAAAESAPVTATQDAAPAEQPTGSPATEPAAESAPVTATQDAAPAEQPTGSPATEPAAESAPVTATQDAAPAAHEPSEISGEENPDP